MLQKNHFSILYFKLILLFTLFFSCSAKKQDYISIATAANMQFAMKKITKEFNNKTGIKCEIMVSSSGKLTAQIKEGAPYDIFVSADMKFPNELYNSGFTTTEPVIYGYGKLVMWTLFDSMKPSFEILQNKKIKHIAVANQKTAPYGRAAHEVFQKKNILSQLQSKFVFGESVAQTNQFITTKAAEIGFTAKSVVVSPQTKGKGNWIEINEEFYTPISQGIVILKNGTGNHNHSQQFYNFLLSEEGKNILSKFGYSTN